MKYEDLKYFILENNFKAKTRIGIDVVIKPRHPLMKKLGLRAGVAVQTAQGEAIILGVGVHPHFINNKKPQDVLFYARKADVNQNGEIQIRVEDECESLEALKKSSMQVEKFPEFLAPLDSETKIKLFLRFTLWDKNPPFNSFDTKLKERILEKVLNEIESESVPYACIRNL